MTLLYILVKSSLSKGMRVRAQSLDILFFIDSKSFSENLSHSMRTTRSKEGKMCTFWFWLSASTYSMARFSSILPVKFLSAMALTTVFCFKWVIISLTFKLKAGCNSESFREPKSSSFYSSLWGGTKAKQLRLTSPPKYSLMHLLISFLFLA